MRIELKEALGEIDTSSLPEERAKQYNQIVGELDGNLDDLTHLNLIVEHYHNFAQIVSWMLPKFTEDGNNTVNKLLWFE